MSVSHVGTTAITGTGSIVLPVAVQDFTLTIHGMPLKVQLRPGAKNEASSVDNQAVWTLPYPASGGASVWMRELETHNGKAKIHLVMQGFPRSADEQAVVVNYSII